MNQLNDLLDLTTASSQLVREIADIFREYVEAMESVL